MCDLTEMVAIQKANAENPILKKWMEQKKHFALVGSVRVMRYDGKWYQIIPGHGRMTPIHSLDDLVVEEDGT